MRRANVFVDSTFAGELQEILPGKNYHFVYASGYNGLPVSLTMPTTKQLHEFDQFPPFFEGLLPEGMMLEGLLRQAKINRSDLMSQIIAVGRDLVGNVTVEAAE